jgi:hypothetical protein
VVINAQPGVARPRIPEIIPEGVDAFARVKRPHCIGPALGDELVVGIADLRTKQCVVQPSLRLIDVKVSRHVFQRLDHTSFS